MQAVTLNNGVQMPILGFGVYQIPAGQTGQAVTEALAAGYRHIDTAAAYQNEEAVGRAIKNSGTPARSYSSLPSCGSKTPPAKPTPRRRSSVPWNGSAWTTSTSTSSTSPSGTTTATGGPCKTSTGKA